MSAATAPRLSEGERERGGDAGGVERGDISGGVLEPPPAGELCDTFSGDRGRGDTTLDRIRLGGGMEK
eukprot:6353898-Prymnesium_polylepis.1